MHSQTQETALWVFCCTPLFWGVLTAFYYLLFLAFLTSFHLFFRKTLFVRLPPSRGVYRQAARVLLQWMNFFYPYVSLSAKPTGTLKDRRGPLVTRKRSSKGPGCIECAVLPLPLPLGPLLLYIHCSSNLNREDQWFNVLQFFGLSLLTKINLEKWTKKEGKETNEQRFYIWRVGGGPLFAVEMKKIFIEKISFVLFKPM